MYLWTLKTSLRVGVFVDQYPILGEDSDVEDRKSWKIAWTQTAFALKEGVVDEEDGLPAELRRVRRYLLTLQKPEGMTEKAFSSFKQYALEWSTSKMALGQK